MRFGRNWLGISLIALGLLFLLETWGVWDFGQFVHVWWPLMFILWGVYLLRRNFAVSKGARNVGAGAPSTGSMSDESVFEEVNAVIASKDFAGGKFSSVFGSVRLDLTSAGLARGEHLLSVSTVFGSIVILLPRDGAYSAATSTVFGEVEIEQQKRGGMLADLRVESPDFHTASARIRIRTSAVFGQIRIGRG